MSLDSESDQLRARALDLQAQHDQLRRQAAEETRAYRQQLERRGPATLEAGRFPRQGGSRAQFGDEIRAAEVIVTTARRFVAEKEAAFVEAVQTGKGVERARRALDNAEAGLEQAKHDFRRLAEQRDVAAGMGSDVAEQRLRSARGGADQQQGPSSLEARWIWEEPKESFPARIYNSPNDNPDITLREAQEQLGTPSFSQAMREVDDINRQAGLVAHTERKIGTWVDSQGRKWIDPTVVSHVESYGHPSDVYRSAASQGYSHNQEGTAIWMRSENGKDSLFLFEVPKDKNWNQDTFWQAMVFPLTLQGRRTQLLTQDL